MSKGVRYMVASAFFFSIMSLLVKVAGERFPSMEIVLARGVVSLILSYWLVRRARLSPWGRRKGILVVRGVFGFLALSAYYFALTRLPIAEATVLQYTSPLFTAFLAAAFLRERLGLSVLAATAACLIGIALVTRPGFLFATGEVQLDRLAIGVALVGAALSGVAYVAVRYASRTEDPLVIVLYFPLIAVPASIPFVVKDFVWPTGSEWLVLAGVGIATQIAQVYLTRGLALVPAGRAMAIGYIQILFAALWGVVLFAEIPGPLSILGSLLIAAGTLSVALRGRS